MVYPASSICSYLGAASNSLINLPTNRYGSKKPKLKITKDQGIAGRISAFLSCFFLAFASCFLRLVSAFVVLCDIGRIEGSKYQLKSKLLRGEVKVDGRILSSVGSCVLKKVVLWKV